MSLVDKAKTWHSVAFVIVSDESFGKVLEFVEDKGWELPVYLAEERSPLFQTGAIPSTFILDGDRRVVYPHIRSAAWDDAAAKDFIDRLLEAPAWARPLGTRASRPARVLAHWLELAAANRSGRGRPFATRDEDVRGPSAAGVF